MIEVSVGTGKVAHITVAPKSKWGETIALTGELTATLICGAGTATPVTDHPLEFTLALDEEAEPVSEPSGDGAPFAKAKDLDAVFRISGDGISEIVRVVLEATAVASLSITTAVESA